MYTEKDILYYVEMFYGEVCNNVYATGLAEHLQEELIDNVKESYEKVVESVTADKELKKK